MHSKLWVVLKKKTGIINQLNLREWITDEEVATKKNLNLKLRSNKFKYFENTNLKILKINSESSK